MSDESLAEVLAVVSLGPLAILLRANHVGSRAIIHFGRFMRS